MDHFSIAGVDQFTTVANSKLINISIRMLIQARILSQLTHSGGPDALICNIETLGDIIKFVDTENVFTKKQIYKIVEYGMDRATLSNSKYQFFNAINIENYDKVINEKTSKVNKFQNNFNNNTVYPMDADTYLKVLEDHQSDILKQMSEIQLQDKSNGKLESELQKIEQEIQKLKQDMKQSQIRFS